MTPSTFQRVLAVAALALGAAGCNCGKPTVTNTVSSLSVSPEVLEFGAIPEGTSRASRFRVENAGRAPENLTVALAAGSSDDFALGQLPASVEGGGYVEVLVTFTPAGAGEDTGTVEVRSASPDVPVLQVQLHGGPIAPELTFAPDPLDFRPSTATLESKPAVLKSTGSAALHLRAVGVDATGNPDFSVSSPVLPATLMPGESVSVTVQYARSVHDTEGTLLAQSDAADAGLRRLRLIPDPTLATCANGAARACYTGPGPTRGVGRCRDGQEPCADGGWAGTCPGEVLPAPSEIRNNGIDDDCDITTPDNCGTDAGTPDAGPPTDGGCNPNGLYAVAVTGGGSLRYACCNFGLGPTVDFDITQLLLQMGGATVNGLTKQPGASLTGQATTCPSGTIDVTRVLSGGCTETYRIQGSFTSANVFTGTYTASFAGADCTGSLCAGDPCANQTWSFTATR